MAQLETTLDAMPEVIIDDTRDFLAHWDEKEALFILRLGNGREISYDPKERRLGCLRATVKELEYSISENRWNPDNFTIHRSFRWI